MILEEFTRRAMLEYQTARLAEAMGSEVENMPDLAELRERFDAMLCRPPKESTLDPHERALRYALGIKGVG